MIKASLRRTDPEITTGEMTGWRTREVMET